MKYARHTYSVVTNACLILGVASALGFDRTHHIAWLVLGSCAATGAITVYIARHWQPNRRAGLNRPSSTPANAIEGAWSEASVSPVFSKRYASPAQPPRVAYWMTEEWWISPYKSYSHRVDDPAEQVARIVRQLQATGKRHTYTVAITPDGDITLSFTDAAERLETGMPQATAKLVPETVH